MKRFFTLLVSAFLCTMVMGQAPTAVIKKASVAPVIDGIVDAVWADAPENAIDKPFVNAGVPETPTVGNSWWKMLWTKDGLYLLTYVEDDVYVPAYLGTDPNSSWMYDKLEVYFDCNSVKQDKLGPSAAATVGMKNGGQGHYQVAPTEVKAIENGGTATTETNGVVWAFNATARPHYYVEEFIPFAMLKDKDGATVDVTGEIGFDVNIMDNDILTPKRNRMDWASAGANGENWSNMDDAGIITLEGAVAFTLITDITIAGGAITSDNGTLQLSPVILPIDASIKQLDYVVTGGTGKASISATGLVTGLMNGTVTLRVAATDGSAVESNEVTITISDQVVTIDKINMLKNSNFTLGLDGKESWGGKGVVADGWYNVDCVSRAADLSATPPVTASNIWDNMFGQGVKVADDTTKYVVMFKAKASVNMTIPMLFEDRGYSNDKVETSLSTYRDNGYGKWDVPVTTEETRFIIDVTFSNFRELSAYELNFQLGKNDGTLSITSMQMVKKADLALVTTGVSKQLSNVLSVYPNPVVDELTVTMPALNGKVAIFNSLGQKMMEKVSNGNVAKFDVSSLRKGLYFVKLGDGSTQKFIK